MRDPLLEGNIEKVREYLNSLDREKAAALVEKCQVVVLPYAHIPLALRLSLGCGHSVRPSGELLQGQAGDS